MLLDLLDKTMVIQSRSTAKDSIGGIAANGYTNRLSGIPCTVWPARAGTVEQYAKRDELAQYEIATAQDVNASADERAIITSALNTAGQNYTVLGYERFENAAMFSDTVYLVVVGLRNNG